VRLPPLPTRRDWIAAGLAAALLCVGADLVVAVLRLLGATPGVDPDASAPTTAAYRVVLLKGLLPQLAGTVLVHPWLRRYRVTHAGRAHAHEARRPGGGTLLVETTVVASLAYCAVAPTLLATAWPGWPALRLAGPAAQLGAYVVLTAAVAGTLRASATWVERRGATRDEGAHG
jgi:hypothetical protein